MSQSVAYDANWYPEIIRYNSQYHRRLRLSNSAEMRKAFRAGDFSIVPYYESIADVKAEAKIAALLALQEKMESDNAINPVILKLYQAKIKEKIGLVELVQMAAHAQRGMVSSEVFTERTEKLYTPPLWEIFKVQIEQVRSVLAEYDAASQPENHSSQILRRWLATLPVNQIPLSTNVPKANQIKTELVFSDESEIKTYLETKLMETGLSHWQIITHPTAKSFRVALRKNTLYIPRNEIIRNRKHGRQLTQANLDGLFAHEILTHAVRHEQGEASALKLLGIGLAGYLRGEEGVATYYEQQGSGATEYAGFNSYLALGLAYGLDQGGEKRSVAAVYELLTAYLMVSLRCSRTYATSKSFSLCHRTFVFTPYPENVLIFTRDTVYREGNIAIHNAVAENPEITKLFAIGKFDPTNPEHTTALQTLGIM